MLSMNHHKMLYTLVVLGVGTILFLLLVFGRSEPEKRPPTPPLPPLVEVLLAHPTSHQLLVHTQGNIQPHREIDLVAQVTGKITAANSAFSDGSFFQQDELLINIEQDDYQIIEQQANAKVANAKQLLAEERGRARQAKREWRDLGNAEANELFLRLPQLTSAEAALASAKASLNKARLDIKRTQIRAPFAGRIRQTRVNIGQYVTTGTPLARIYSTDIAEVRLPLTDRQAAMLILPEHNQQTTNDQSQHGIPVQIKNQFNGNNGSWLAHIVRTDASIDLESRQLFVVAEIKKPFIRNSNNQQQPTLKIGQFVNAYINGKVVDNVLILPRKALRPQNKIWVVDTNNQLKIIEVDVLQSRQGEVIIQNGLTGPQQVIVSNLSLAVNGMALTLSDAPNNTAPLSAEAAQ